VTHALYQVRLIIKPEYEAEFNAWYEGEYIPKLMRMTPHFRVCRRYKGDFNGQTLYVTDYETTSETMEVAISEMRQPARVDDNRAFYEWKDRAILLHESVQLHEVLQIEQPEPLPEAG
jgi:hypothetical protein